MSAVADGEQHRPALRWGAASHAGQVRTENEDSYVAEPLVFAVADGMGGHQAGEVASALAVQTMRDRLGDGVTSLDVVIASVVEANAAIFQAAHRNAAQQGMGTTLTAIAVLAATDEHPRTLALVNVGDSRTYRVRSGKLERVTIDHSYVQELVATGHISEMEARTHPRRNIVTRALGIEPVVRVDSWVLSLVKGDRFVLCSDGLVDEVPDHEIELVASGLADPQAAADELVAMANRHGGRDNVTVVVVDVLEGLEVPAELPALTPSAAASLGDTATVPVVDGDGAAPPTTMLRATPAAEATAVDPEPSPAARPQQAEPDATTATSASPKRKRRFTAGMFLFLLALALIVTVTVTLLAVSLTGDDDPADPTDDTTVSTEVDATDPDTTRGTTPDSAPETAPPTLPPTTLPSDTAVGERSTIGRSTGP